MFISLSLAHPLFIIPLSFLSPYLSPTPNKTKLYSPLASFNFKNWIRTYCYFQLIVIPLWQKTKFVLIPLLHIILPLAYLEGASMLRDDWWLQQLLVSWFGSLTHYPDNNYTCIDNLLLCHFTAFLFIIYPLTWPYHIPCASPATIQILIHTYHNLPFLFTIIMDSTFIASIRSLYNNSYANKKKHTTCDISQFLRSNHRGK